MPSARTPDGVDIAWRDYGGSGPDLILAHATGFCGGVWGPVAERLSDRFRVVTFDERGHGASSGTPDGTYAWDGYALDALTVIDAAGLERPFGAGHSCGAALLFLAEQARPGTLAGVWAFEPIMFPPRRLVRHENPLAAGARRRRATFASRDEAFDHYSAKRPLNALDPAVLRAYVECGFVDNADGVRLACEPETEARTYEMGGQHGAFDRLGEIGCPVVLLCGEHTDAITPSFISAQAERVPDASTEVWAGQNHFAPLADPERAASSIISAFLG